MIKAFLATLAVVVALAQGGAMPGFDGNTGWLNSPPLGPADLRGKVVLVDFWEYTCVNCLRTLPYLRQWYARYRDHGFVIVGVHTPEFKFSGERDNVAAALLRLNVTWPVVLDGNYAIWKRYENSSWPREFLFDQKGNLVESVVGEGLYQQTESRIQSLVRAGDPQLKLPPVMALLPQDSYDKPGAVCYPKTNEILIGHQRIANAPALRDPNADLDYHDPGSHADGEIYLSGYWHRGEDGVVAAGGDGYLALRYHAIQVVGVMKPDSGKPVRVTVTQDGNPIARQDAGSDIRYDDHGNSYVTVDSARAYDLVMNAQFGQHDLRVVPQGYGLTIDDFAFESCEVPGAH
jgi:thiol-disulfide isomerase/thioredoxin